MCSIAGTGATPPLAAHSASLIACTRVSQELVWLCALSCPCPLYSMGRTAWPRRQHYHGITNA